MQANEVKPISKDTIEHAMSYGEYRKMIENLLAKGKTTGPNQSEAMTEYTRKNVRRMNRVGKETKLNDSLKKKLKALDTPMIWLVLTEGWCGDAAQNIPVLNKMADASPHVKLKLILRDEHTDIMDQYLTNGGRSIPKLVCLHGETLEELGTWGPRPGDFQEKAMAWKDDPEISKKEWAGKLHAWYEDDETQTLQADFDMLIEEWG
jgi:hypothetical protein